MSEKEPMSYREKVEAKRNEMVNTMLDFIQNNSAEWERGWYMSASELPANGSTGKPYRGINMLYLMMVAAQKGYTDNRWVTFNQAHELGAHVKRGEKAREIFYWSQYDKLTKKPFDEKTVEGMTQEEKITYLEENVRHVLKFYQVFNAEQCDNFSERKKEELTLEMAEEERARQNALIEQVIKNSAAPIYYGGSKAYYSPSLDEIHLPKIEDFKSMQDYYATALHEIAHSTGHESRLNRDLKGIFGTEDYAKEDLRAELASVFMQTELGISIEGHHFENHGAYLTSWLKAVREDTKEFFAAARDAEKISDYVAEHYLQAERSEENAQEKNHSNESDALPVFERNVPFADQVDRVLSGADTTNSHLEVLPTTPQILQDVGLPNLPILMTAKHLKSITQESGADSMNYHALGAEMAKQIPELLSDPVMIMDSFTREDSIVVVTESLDKENHPVIGAIKVNGLGYSNEIEISANILTSVYGKENFQSFLERNLESGNILYYNKKKSQALFEIPGIQFPNNLNSLDSNTIIRKSRAFVKPSAEKNSENLSKSQAGKEDYKEKQVQLGPEIYEALGGYDNNMPRTVEVARTDAQACVEASGEPYITIETAERKSLSADAAWFKPGMILSLSEADKYFEKINTDFVASGASEQIKMKLDFIFEGKKCSTDLTYNFGMEKGGIVEAFADAIKASPNFTERDYAIYFRQHKDLVDMEYKAIADNLPMAEQYNIEGYVLAARNAVNTSVPFSMYELPKYESEAQQAGDKVINSGYLEVLALKYQEREQHEENAQKEETGREEYEEFQKQVGEEDNARNRVRNEQDLQKDLYFKDWFNNELLMEERGIDSQWTDDPDKAYEHFSVMYDNELLDARFMPPKQPQNKSELGRSDSEDGVLEAPQKANAEVKSKREWLVLDIPAELLGAESESKARMIKLPQGEYSHFVLFVPKAWLKPGEKEGTMKLSVDANSEYIIRNDGREVKLSGSELRAAFEGKEVGKSAQRTAPSRRSVEAMDKLTANVPEEMKSLPNWCVFHTKWNAEKGKKDKTIVSPVDGKWAKSNDPSKWTDFETAKQYALEHGAEGLAFALDAASGISCIDLDKCIDKDGRLTETAQKLTSEISETYTETSASGNGIHIFLKDDILVGGKIKNRVETKDGEIEVYDSGRFISMTGNVRTNVRTLGKTPQTTKAWLRRTLGERAPQQTFTPNANVEGSDQEIIDRIRKSKKGPEFDALMAGENLANDHSRSDYRLLNMLAFFTDGNHEQMARIFRTSGLYRPEKGEPYLQRSVTAACNGLTSRYGQGKSGAFGSASKGSSNGKGKH